MTETTTNTKSNLVGRAVRDVTSIGRSWAAYGLTVSKTALETSALTLRKTADWLASLSARVSPKNGEAAKVETPSTVQ